MSPGQTAALGQLRELEDASEGILEIVDVRPADETDPALRVVLSVDCSDFDRTADGLPLRSRERFVLIIGPDFPFRVPQVFTTHRRFAGFPHVQWGHSLCLYQSPATEWDSSDGMFGFLGRLAHWLRRGALGQFEAVGEPLHPPVAYFTRGTPLVIPRADTPAVSEGPWVGLAHLNPVTERRVDIVGWSEPFAEPFPSRAAAAVLLPGTLSWEFPTNGGELIKSLVAAGVPKNVLLMVFALATLTGSEGEPLYIVVGARMRGIAGTGDLRQHLSVWRVPAEKAVHLRTSLAKEGDTDELREIRSELRRLTGEILELSSVEWCRVREDRPEIVTRRDVGTPASWFIGKAVAIWGCGALGGVVAEALTRAGVRKLVLYDKSDVAPGVLARQPFDDADVGTDKAYALADRLRRITPQVDVEANSGDVLDHPLGAGDWTDGVDLVIDASTSGAVLEKLELIRRSTSRRAIPAASMVIGHDATTGFVVLSGSEYSGGPLDVVRRAKIAVCNREDLRHFADEFWPGETRRTPFQPEPGCSEATFVGSWTDMMGLGGALLNLLGNDLRSCPADVAAAHLIMQPHVPLDPPRPRQADFVWQPDVLLRDPHSGHEIRLRSGAWREIRGWIETSRRRHGSLPETGGVLFGERNEAAGVIWVDEVLGPPSDSTASPDVFLCGTAGVREANDEKRVRTRASVQIVGMWHTHPRSAPAPSARDFSGVAQIVTAKEPPTPKFLLLILGYTSRPENWTAGAYVFSRQDFEDLRYGRRIRVMETRRLPDGVGSGSIGLSLSGGGSRAMAFHLGCLRALHDLGLLFRIEVVSAVSGGSVLAGAYAYSKGDFADFDRTVTRVLRRGLAGAIAWRTLFSVRTPRAAATVLFAGGAALLTGTVRRGWFLLARGLGRKTRGVPHSSDLIQPPLTRRYTRSHAFQDALRAAFFRDTKLVDERRGAIDVVFNACELRTGTAFRFGSRESGAWRFGRLKDNDVDVAHAVAASAAYPALLPAFDERLTFVRRDGREHEARVILTDGGVVENLGVSCLEPQREFGFNTFRTDYIIACDAGAGQFSGVEIPYGWMGRMTRSFESVFRKAHDATLQRLHTYVPTGHLRGFVLAYLGQIDKTLPFQPPDLVKREEVAAYPTDFSAMSQVDVERLALRGEQLTRLLVERYCTEL